MRTFQLFAHIFPPSPFFRCVFSLLLLHQINSCPLSLADLPSPEQQLQLVHQRDALLLVWCSIARLREKSPQRLCSNVSDFFFVGFPLPIIFRKLNFSFFMWAWLLFGGFDFHLHSIVACLGGSHVQAAGRDAGPHDRLVLQRQCATVK